MSWQPSGWQYDPDDSGGGGGSSSSSVAGTGRRAFYTFDPKLCQIFDEAAERAGIDPPSLGTQLIQSARRSLAFMLGSEWLTFGFNQWQIFTHTETMTVGKQSFFLPAGGVDIWDAVHVRDGKATEMYGISRDEYFILVDRTREGRPDRFFVDKTGVRAQVFFWQAGVNTSDQIKVQYLRQNPNATEDNTPLKATLEMPPTCFECCVAGLAWRLALKFNVDREANLKRYYGGPDYPDRLGGTIELMRQANRDRGDIDLYPAYGPRTSRR